MSTLAPNKKTPFNNPFHLDNPAPFGRFPHEKDREKEVIVGRYELDLKKEKTQLRDRKGARHFKELCVAD
ncbi:hypothetical protein P9156_02595 [Bacillus amyloliquefaciens]|nr:hypothetical protein [Bacillus amyloliquefaciens]MEC3839098.1 hypothetical protein [Bacillus amyloliquefaciens]